jgi:FkbM family methyltransferase
VDIGANTGMFALYAHRSYPGARVVGYEPLPLNYQRFCTNLRDNGIEGVEAVNKGVGGTARRASLHLHPKNTGGHSLIASSLPGSSEAVEIDIVPIAEVVADAGGPIDLMKIDCEGAEHEIVMAMTEAQARAIRLMVIEPSYKLYDKADFLAKLEALGFDCRSHGDLLLAERRREREPSRAPAAQA